MNSVLARIIADEIKGWTQDTHFACAHISDYDTRITVLEPGLRSLEAAIERERLTVIKEIVVKFLDDLAAVK